MDLTVLLALLVFCTAASAVDSEGTSFVFAFVRNANKNIDNQILTATVLNRNAQDCKFTLTYRPDYHKSTPAENITQTVSSLSAVEVEIPSWYGWNYAGNNIQDDVYLTLTGYSTCPVTVLANNYDNVTKQGDTYMVLPTTWGSQSFTFSLPPAITSATEDHYEQVYVLPTTEGSTRVTITEIGNAQSVFYANATYGDFPAMYVGARTPDSRPRTYHVMSDKPVVIVAGVTCAGVVADGCDHIAYMPHPPASSDCYTYDYYDDDHISFLPTTSQFFTDIPGTCLVPQNITSILNDGVSKTMRIKAQMESPLWTITTTNDNQLGVAFHNGGSNIHIARYYDGTKFNARGAFIATSPSIPQFHNDYTAFYTRNTNDSLEIYCTVLSCASLTLDGVAVVSQAAQRVTQTVDGTSYFIFVVTVSQPGFHQLDLDPSKKGNYAFFVFGKNGQYSYGYEGGANKPTFVLAPATSPAPGATTTTAAAITGSTPTIATVPTVTVPIATTATSVPITTTTNAAVTTVTTATTGSVTGVTNPVTPATTPSPIPTLSTATTAVPATTAPNTSTQPFVVTSTTDALTSASSQLPAITTTATIATVPTNPATTRTPTSPSGSSPTTPSATRTTQTVAITTTAATTTQPPVATTTQTQAVTTTQTPIATTAKTPFPASPTTPTPAPQTPLPTSAGTSVVTTLKITTNTPRTASSVSTPVTTQSQPSSSQTTRVPVNTPTTPPAVTQPSTKTASSSTASSVTTASTQPPATTRTSTVRTVPSTTTTTTQPSTTTQSSSVTSLVIPVFLTFLIALL